MGKKKKEISLLDQCVREASRLGYGVHYGAFVADIEKVYGSLKAYFNGPPAAVPPFGRKIAEKTVDAPKVKWTADLRYCKRCGAPVPSGAEHLWFCSDYCYQASRDESKKRWHDSHKQNVSPRPCQICGKLMTEVVRKEQKYCSAKCRNKAKYQNRLASVIADPLPVTPLPGTKKY